MSTLRGSHNPVEERARGAPKPQPSSTAATKPKAALKLVKCNRCGEEGLCWQESKNGKFYLCRTRREANGEIVPLRKEFHQCR
jgi:ssDNA-binding Zn-finger/Zn-ribbon topoisomerase 1